MGAFAAVSKRDSSSRVQTGWTGTALDAIEEVMAEQDKTHKLSWPWWSPWALAAVVATSLLTIAATLYDIF